MIIKFIKSLIRAELINFPVKNNTKQVKNEKRYNFGKLYKNKKFYIIKKKFN